MAESAPSRMFTDNTSFNFKLWSLVHGIRSATQSTRAHLNFPPWLVPVHGEKK
jgi:hypothetical protein